MKNKWLGVWVLVLAIAAIAPSWAQNGSWITVTRKAGQVESCLQDSATWLRITKDRRLGTEDKVRTQADSAAQLRLADNSLLAMGANTSVTLRQYVYSKQERVVRMDVKRGTVRTGVAKFNGEFNCYQIRTPNTVMAAQGTNFAIVVEYADGSAEADDLSISTDSFGSESDSTNAQVVESDNSELDGSDESSEPQDGDADSQPRCITKIAVFEGQVSVANGPDSSPLLVEAGNTAQVLGLHTPILNPQEFLFDQASNYFNSIPVIRELVPLGDLLRTPEQLVDEVTNRAKGRLPWPF